MKKIALFLLLLIMVSASLVFAGIDDLNFEKETGIMTYTYIIKGNLPNYDDLSVNNRILKLRAIGELSGVLQEFFYLNKVNLSMVEYEFLPEKIIMNADFDKFSKLNFRKI